MVDPCQILGKSDADTRQTVSDSTFIFEKSFYFVVTAAANERLSNGRGPTDDFRRIMSCAKYFAQEGRSVIMTPKLNVTYKNPAYDMIYGTLKGTPYYGKCPDLSVDGIWYEHESFSGNFAKKSFRNMCNHGSKQSARIIVDYCGLTDGYMLRSIASRIAVGIDIQEVWIRYDDILRLIYKTEGQ